MLVGFLHKHEISKNLFQRFHYSSKLDEIFNDS